jgi:DNA-binding CsgD family transcriptional regulator
VTEPTAIAHLDLIRAVVSGRRGSPIDTHELLLEAARQVAPTMPERAVDLVLWSLFAGLQGGWPERALAAVAPALDEIGEAGAFGVFGHALVEGASALLEGEQVCARERLEEAIVVGQELGSGRLTSMPAFVCLFTGDFARASSIATRAVADLRDQGALAVLVGNLTFLAGAQTAARDIKAAATTAPEALELSRQLGYENDVTGVTGLMARIAAFQGREEESRQYAEDAIRRAVANGVGWATINARLGLAELELGLGNAREALEQLEQLDPTPLPPMATIATPDYIDAALRLGETERAAAAVERFAAWAPINEGPLIQGMLARCRAIVADDPEEADGLFAEALALHALDVPPYERGRTQLAYGERLRRDRRKIDARTQLRAALDIFEGLGAAFFAERARAELRATGETARKRDASTLDDLTPQELRIASLVAGGASNRDVAAQIFVSPKTVEYHLRKVFLKLGVASRVELARTPLALAGQGSD